MKKREKWQDDGRRIADMSGTVRAPYRPPLENASPVPVAAPQASAGENAENTPPPEMLSRKDTWKVSFATMGIALGIGLIFMGAIALFILFATNVWLK